MSSRTTVHTEENKFKNIGVGDLVEFGSNGDALLVVYKETMVYNNVLTETMLHCSNGNYTRVVGHMDKDAPSLHPLILENALLVLLMQKRGLS